MLQCMSRCDESLKCRFQLSVLVVAVAHGATTAHSFRCKEMQQLKQVPMWSIAATKS